MPSPKDPRASHPQFTPSERAPRMMGVTVPRIEVKEQEQPPESKRSMWPVNIHKEANIKVPVSLGFIGIMMASAFWAGDRRSVETQAIMAEVKELRAEIVKLKERAVEAEQECKLEQRQLSSIESSQSKTQAEIVQLNSRLK
jgi:hypothetical protein